VLKWVGWFCLQLPDSSPEKLSLLLLTLPSLGRLKEAVERLLRSAQHASVLLAFAGHSCTQLADWEVVCNCVLRKLAPASVLTSASDSKSDASAQSEAEAESDAESGAKPYSRVYHALLEHLVATLPPEQFLTLLPANGSSRFYLPVLAAAQHTIHARQISFL
jgi:hypothetical protein